MWLLLLAFSAGKVGINWILLFEAYNHTTVAVATLCYYMEPTIVVLLSPFIFQEWLTGKKAACAAVSIIGMVLVSGVIGDGGGQSGTSSSRRWIILCHGKRGQRRWSPSTIPANVGESRYR